MAAERSLLASYGGGVAPGRRAKGYGETFGVAKAALSLNRMAHGFWVYRGEAKTSKKLLMRSMFTEKAGNNRACLLPTEQMAFICGALMKNMENI